MNSSISYRLPLVIAAIIICTLLFNVYIFIKPMVFPEKLSFNTVDISRYANRFLPVRPMLQRGVAGYISDDTTDEDISKAHLYVARYSLSPVILVRSLDYPIIVGNFQNPAHAFELYAKKGIIPIKDFGNGVVLFKKETR